MVEFNPNQKINIGLALVKIMTSSTCPTIYNEKTDAEAHELLTKLTDHKRKEFVDLIQKYKVDNIVSHILF